MHSVGSKLYKDLEAPDWGKYFFAIVNLYEDFPKAKRKEKDIEDMTTVQLAIEYDDLLEDLNLTLCSSCRTYVEELTDSLVCRACEDELDALRLEEWN